MKIPGRVVAGAAVAVFGLAALGHATGGVTYTHPAQGMAEAAAGPLLTARHGHRHPVVTVGQLRPQKTAQGAGGGHLRVPHPRPYLGWRAARWVVHPRLLPWWLRRRN